MCTFKSALCIDKCQNMALGTVPHTSERVKFLVRHVPTRASIHAPPLCATHRDDCSNDVSSSTCAFINSDSGFTSRTECPESSVHRSPAWSSSQNWCWVLRVRCPSAGVGRLARVECAASWGPLLSGARLRPRLLAAARTTPPRGHCGHRRAARATLSWRAASGVPLCSDTQVDAYYAYYAVRLLRGLHLLLDSPLLLVAQDSYGHRKTVLFKWKR